MLAQNFMSPAELGITNQEFEAHVHVLGMLERQELTDDPRYYADRCAGYGLRPYEFNMGVSFAKTSCGTTACIGGWVAQVMEHFDPNFYVHLQSKKTAPLHELYWNFGCRCERVTTDKAAMALRNFLTFGSPRWREVMGPDGHIEKLYQAPAEAVGPESALMELASC